MSEGHIEHWTGERMVKEIKRLRAEANEQKRIWQDTNSAHAAALRDAIEETELLRAENERLQATLDAHKKATEAIQEECAEIVAENARLRVDVAQHDEICEHAKDVRDENVRLDARVAELEAALSKPVEAK